MGKKLLLIFLVVTVGLVGAVYFYIIRSKEFQTVIAPMVKIDAVDKIGNAFKNVVQEEKKKLFGERINILLVGTDTSNLRRAKGQLGFNTDTMILLTIDTKYNKVLLTSVPRDLWINGNKINALYTVYGEEVLVDAFNKVTGQTVDRVIRVDFDQFSWIVDSFGGVPVDVPNGFSDPSFPVAGDTGIQTVTFTKGMEVMDSTRALTYARSRKGNNGEGSDLMRAKRQHLILKAMLEAVKQPASKFWPMDVKRFLEEIIKQGVHTTLSLEECIYLWDFYKDKDKYEIESFVIDGKYVYHPGMYPQSEFRAWVFIEKEPGFANLHADIEAKLNKTYVDPDAVIPASTAPTTTTTN